MRGGVGVLAGLAALVVFAGVAAAGGGTLVVSAGLDQDVVLGDTVYFDAGGTHVVDGDLDGIAWSIETPDGRTITPDCVDCELTHFRPNQTGQYDVTLTARSASGEERSDTLYVTVGERTGSVPTVSVGNQTGASSGSGQGSVGGGSQNSGCFIAMSNAAIGNGICDHHGSLVGAYTDPDDPDTMTHVVFGNDGALTTMYSEYSRQADGDIVVPVDVLDSEINDLAHEQIDREGMQDSNYGNRSSNHNGGGSNYGSGPSHGDQEDIGNSDDSNLETCNNVPSSYC